MSIITFFENTWASIVGEAEVVLSDVEAGFNTANNFVGTVLGQVQEVEPIIATVDPALGAAVTAGVSALQSLQSDIASALKTTEADATAVASQVTSLTAQAVQLAVQAAPFYKAVANDAAAVSVAAVDAVKSVTSPIVTAS